MTTNEAKKTISEITADILTSRGDMGLEQTRKWARAYTFYGDACEALTSEEIDDAMFDGLRAYQASVEEAEESDEN